MEQGSSLAAALNFADIQRELIRPLVLLLFALAVVYFLYGVFQFIRGADDEGARKIGREHMIYGVIGLAIMVSVFGIMRVICNTIGCN